MKTMYNSLAEFLEAHGCDTFNRFGRQLYKVTVGVWVTAQLRMEPEIYYTDERARQTDWHPKCIGIRCGSIIEGAHYDATPFEVRFPFTDQSWNEQLAELEDEVRTEWAINNEEGTDE